MAKAKTVNDEDLKAIQSEISGTTKKLNAIRFGKSASESNWSSFQRRIAMSHFDRDMTGKKPDDEKTVLLMHGSELEEAEVVHTAVRMVLAKAA